jgi:hypothetical protein
MFPAVGLSLTALVAVSYMTPRPSEHVLAKFFDFGD